jgi:hypothetical protein
VTVAARLRPTWERGVLDFLTLRGSILFKDWSPRSVPNIVKHLAERDWELILAANLLLAPRLGERIALVRRLAPREMEQEARPRLRETRGRLRGAPSYRATVLERIRRGDPSLWLVQQRYRVWQTEANAAVVGFLAYLARLAPKVALLVPTRSGTVLEVAKQIDDLLRSEPVRHVVPNPDWASVTIPPSLFAKSTFYRVIWSFAAALRDSRTSRSPEALRRVIEGGWLAAEDDDKLFELYLFSLLIEKLHGLGPWTTFVYKGLGDSQSSGIVATRSGLTARLLYDRSPTVPGHYAWLINRYVGIDGRGRRPDFQLIVEREQQRRTTLVEAKATEPNSLYGRDSVVKVLGYLKDFEQMWTSEESVVYPRAVLAYAGDLTSEVPISTRVSNDEVILTCTQTLDQDLDTILKHVLAV